MTPSIVSSRQSTRAPASTRAGALAFGAGKGGPIRAVDGWALSEHVRATLRQLHESAALMQFQPTERNRALEPRGVFRWCSLVAEQEGVVDLLDIDSAVLDRFEGVCVF